MNTFKRLSASIKANIEWMVGQLENHEGLVEATLKEVNQSAAKARVQLARVKQDGQNMKKKLIELRNAEELWLERAKKVGSSDEKRAFACLRRRNVMLEQIKTLENQQLEHSKVEKQLNDDRGKIEEKLQNLKTQKNVMRTRQSRAEALKALKMDDTQIFSEIDSIFERWETKVTEYEIQSGCNLEVSAVDQLEEEFLSVEDEGNLRTQLNDILNIK
jgi:phage shock protein A